MKEPWEIAWEEQYPGDAQSFPSAINNQRFRMIRERWRFENGFKAGREVVLTMIKNDLAELEGHRESGLYSAHYMLYALESSLRKIEDK